MTRKATKSNNGMGRKKMGIRGTEQSKFKVTDHGDEVSTRSPAFNTRNRLRGRTMVASPMPSSFKCTTSAGRPPKSLILAKKSKDRAQETPKSQWFTSDLPSETQETEHESTSSHSSQLNDFINNVSGGKNLRASQPPVKSPLRLRPANKDDFQKCCSTTLEETVSKTTPTTKAIPNNEFAALEFSNRIERSTESNLANSLQYINRLKQPAFASSSSMSIAAEQTPLEEVMVASNFVREGPQGCSSNPRPKTDHLSQTTLSLSFTEMAAMVDDEDEVGSHSSLVTVQGYRVKEASAANLEAIFHKYGDIAAKCSLTKEGRSCLLEGVCDIIQALQETDFVLLDEEEIKRKIDFVCDLGSLNIELPWLHQRLNDILEAKQIVKRSSSFKEAKDKNIKLINEKKIKLKCHELDMVALGNNIRMIKEELAAAEVETDRIGERHSILKGKVRLFYKQSLTKGLL